MFGFVSLKIELYWKRISYKARMITTTTLLSVEKTLCAARAYKIWSGVFLSNWKLKNWNRKCYLASHRHRLIHSRERRERTKNIQTNPIAINSVYHILSSFCYHFIEESDDWWRLYETDTSSAQVLFVEFHVISITFRSLYLIFYGVSKIFISILLSISFLVHF